MNKLGEGYQGFDPQHTLAMYKVGSFYQQPGYYQGIRPTKTGCKAAKIGDPKKWNLNQPEMELERPAQPDVQSTKDNYGKSRFSMGESTINVHFQQLCCQFTKWYLGLKQKDLVEHQRGFCHKSCGAQRKYHPRNVELLGQQDETLNKRSGDYREKNMWIYIYI